MSKPRLDGPLATRSAKLVAALGMLALLGLGGLLVGLTRHDSSPAAPAMNSETTAQDGVPEAQRGGAEPLGPERAGTTTEPSASAMPQVAPPATSAPDAGRPIGVPPEVAKTSRPVRTPPKLAPPPPVRFARPD